MVAGTKESKGGGECDQMYDEHAWVTVYNDYKF